jgi:hypothetical protein
MPCSILLSLKHQIGQTPVGGASRCRILPPGVHPETDPVIPFHVQDAREAAPADIIIVISGPGPDQKVGASLVMDFFHLHFTGCMDLGLRVSPEGL